jgi:integrase
MSLASLLALFISEHPHGIRETTHCFLISCIQCLHRFLGQEPTVEDLNRERINGYIDWMIANRAHATVKSQRGGLMMLWRFAAEEKLCEYPRRIRSPRNIEQVVTTWTPHEVKRLRDHCLGLRGKLPNGIDKAIYFGSLVACGYETGFRLSDQLSLERDWIRTENGVGHLTIIESKTRKQSRRIITADTMELINQCMAQSPDRRIIWPLWARREAFFDRFKKIVYCSGIREGTYKYLRRTACTDVESRAKGLGRDFLNHSSDAVTRASYIDLAQSQPLPLMVTPLAAYLATPGTRDTPPTTEKKATG